MRKKIISPLTFVFLIGALAVSVFLNTRLYALTSTYYRQLNATRLDPLGMSAYDTNTVHKSVVDPDTKLVVFFGDSRAFRWPAVELTLYRFVNRGIGAQTSAQVLARYDAHVASLQPQIVLLQVGINDLKTIPLFPERRDEIVTTLQENIAQIIEKSRAQEATIILTTIFPVGTVPFERRLVWSNAVVEASADVNAYIRDLGEDDVIVFDTVPILASASGQVHEEYQIDLLHINQAGYEALNQELVRILDGIK